MVRAKVLKVLGLIVGLVMVVGMLAGCGPSAPKVVPSPTPTLKGFRGGQVQ